MKARKEFFRITNITPLRLTNRIEDNVLRKDVIFNSLANRVFDSPRLLDLLTVKLESWLAREHDEFIYALAGYIYYLRKEYGTAEKYFLKAVNKNPLNLDNWYDLAFSLYHQGDRKYRLAKRILFNLEGCCRISPKKITLKSLQDFLDRDKRPF
jgi:tetratricopeptide (TPR) repeat protein